MSLRRRLNEPLVHFLLLGGALFVWFEWRGAGPRAERIVVTSAQIDHLAAGFERTWQRPATVAELKSLIDEWVREEIATREATAMGLDRDDTVIRRRLRQKLEFLVEDADPGPPSDEELRRWLASHPEAYRMEARVSFRQVFLRTDLRGDAAESDARRLLAELRAAGASARLDGLGDPSQLPSEGDLEALDLVARDFGPEFSEALAAIEPGSWTGPVRSSFGLHLVFVGEAIAGRPLDLDEVRTQVERDVVVERRRARLTQAYDDLLERYTVVIESRPDPSATGDPR